MQARKQNRKYFCNNKIFIKVDISLQMGVYWKSLHFYIAFP